MFPPDSDSDLEVVFGLTKKQLRPVVDRVARGEMVTSFEVSVDHGVLGPVYGDRGDKAVVTFAYATRSGGTEESSLFVKRQCDSSAVEAFHYASLQQLQAPIPRMYGAITDPDQREVLFLELVDPITEDGASFVRNVGTFGQFLAVTAHFNMIRPSGRYALEVASQDWGRNLETAATMLSKILDRSAQGDLGESMKLFCASRRADISRLQTVAQSLVDPVNQMEIGLCHRDHNPSNLGWRRGTRELLIVDLEMVQLMPRFWDVAQWLGSPDDVWELCRPRQELAQEYLEQYARWGGRPPRVAQFLRELRILWMTRQLSDLWWRLRWALRDETTASRRGSGSGHLHKKREELHSLLEVLVRQASRREW